MITAAMCSYLQVQTSESDSKCHELHLSFLVNYSGKLVHRHILPCQYLAAEELQHAETISKLPHLKQQLQAWES